MQTTSNGKRMKKWTNKRVNVLKNESMLQDKKKTFAMAFSMKTDYPHENKFNLISASFGQAWHLRDLYIYQRKNFRKKMVVCICHFETMSKMHLICFQKHVRQNKLNGQTIKHNARARIHIANENYARFINKNK